MNTKKVAIIPARGGSRRIPKKNIRIFFGKHIIAHSIEASLKSDLFDEIMVSTDDEEIANIAKKCGAKIPFMRSAKNSDDYATTIDVLFEVLETYARIERYFDYFCCIYPAAPFVTANHLVDSYNLLIKKKADAIIPVARYGHPIQRCFKIKENGKLYNLWPKNRKRRTQDCEPTYYDVGQFYWGRISSFFKYRDISAGNLFPYVVRETEFHDIDNLDDWEYAEQKYKLLHWI